MQIVLEDYCFQVKVNMNPQGENKGNEHATQSCCGMRRAFYSYEILWRKSDWIFGVHTE